jgi:hypothetical protein
MTALPAKNPRESETAMGWFITIALCCLIGGSVFTLGYRMFL